MVESSIGDAVQEPENAEKCPQEKTHWIQSFIETFKRYKTEFFGAGDSEIRKQRMLDYTVKPTNDFVLAKYKDGFYRPACISGRSKKKQLLIASFYHSRKCLYVKPDDVIFNHGNLLNMKVSFMRQGKHIKGKVYGNNSPANRGFPSMFYIKKKEKWHKVPVKMIFLTSKQFSRLKCECKSECKGSETKSDSVSNDSDDNCMDISYDTSISHHQIKDLKDLEGDFEMS